MDEGDLSRSPVSEQRVTLVELFHRVDERPAAHNQMGCTDVP